MSMTIECHHSDVDDVDGDDDDDVCESVYIY